MWSSDATAVAVLSTMPPQFEAAGRVAVPSWLVSPPTESSRYEVKVIGATAVPCACSPPLTISREFTPVDLIVVPGSSVSVAPVLAVRLPGRK